MSDFNISLIKVEGLDKFSEPINTLIQKISNAITGGFSPWQTKRLALADVAADLIRAEGAAKVSEIEMRSRYRLLAEEAMRQRNIEDITQQAIEFIADTAAPDQMDDDWIVYFFDKCRIVTNAQMKTLFARVLAMEANAPGAVSKRTVGFLESMERPDADLFSDLCRFIVEPKGSPLITNTRHKIYRDHGVDNDSVRHLESIGLITVSEWDLPHPLYWKEGELGKIRYFDTTIELESSGIRSHYAAIGTIALTRIGRELAPLCKVEPVPGFVDHLLTTYRSHNARIAG